MEQIEKKQLTVIAVPCSRAFVVAPEKREEFKNQKPNPEIRRQKEEILQTLKINNLVSVEEPKKRTRTKN